MDCPHCNSNDVITIDTRKRNNYIIRRKTCMSCTERFSTKEFLVEEVKEMEDAAKTLGKIYELSYKHVNKT